MIVRRQAIRSALASILAPFVAPKAPAAEVSTPEPPVGTYRIELHELGHLAYEQRPLDIAVQADGRIRIEQGPSRYEEALRRNRSPRPESTKAISDPRPPAINSPLILAHSWTDDSDPWGACTRCLRCNVTRATDGPFAGKLYCLRTVWHRDSPYHVDNAGGGQ